jgi:exopolysaccharide biosynthesis polyprenyl glycosylphosphotransferase
VVVPVLNGERILGQCLEALTHQDYPADRLEIIVVDDGSTDSTAQLAQSHPVIYLHQQNSGPAAARNRGAEKSSGDILLFTDADCVPDTNWVSNMVQPFIDNPDVVGVKGKYRTDQRSLIPRMVQLEFEERYHKLRNKKRIDFVDSHSAAFRKSAFDQVNGFNAEFPQANNEDVDLSFRIASSGGRMVFNPDAVVQHTHPRKLFNYIRLKFSRAFWRMLVYKKHPNKAIGDSYTPQTLKLQILFAWAVAAAFIEWLLFPAEGFLPLMISLGAFALSCLPFWWIGIRRDPVMTLLSPPLLFIRALCFGVGVFLGVIFLDRRSSWIRAGLVITDVLLCAFALVVAYYIRTNYIPYPEHFVFPQKAYLTLAIVLPLILVLANWQQGLYRVRSSNTDFHQTTRIFKAHLILALTVMAGFYLLKLTYSRLTLFLFLGISLVLITVSRWMLRKVWIAVMKRGINQSRVVIVGVGETCQLLMEKLRKFPELGYKVVGLIAGNGQTGNVRGVPVLGTYHDIPSVVRQKHIHEVIIADPLVSREKTLELIVRIGQLNLPVKIVSDLYEIITTRTELNGFADIPIIEVPPPRTRPLSSVMKNVVEYVLALMMFALSLPLWVVIWTAIRLTSKGPAIFRQERVGKDGRIFLIYKFRTMYHHVDNYQEAPRVREDPRITKVGRFLRRTSLDEMPQLLNVLKGDMSLVGPRPEMPFIVAQYNEWQRIRLSIKPGLTGLWQILGRKDLYLHENLEYDFFYIKNQSLLLDLIVLMKTIPAVLKGKGAY